VRSRINSVFVSGVLFTVCFLSIARWHLKWALTVTTRHIGVTDTYARLNYEASTAFASLALVIIGLVVVWVGYQKKDRWSWFIMLVFVCVYFVPVHMLDVVLAMRRVGWGWLPGVVRAALDGNPESQGAIEGLAVFTLMVIALLLPIRAFFGKEGVTGVGNKS
jgi:hypothetical protein